MSRSRLLLAVLLFASLAVAVAAVRLNQGKPASTAGQAAYGILTPEQLARMLAQKDFTFVDVHIPYDGEIDKTDAFIPYNEMSKNLAQLPANKNARIVLYCRSGRMSSIAAEELVKRGYTNVSHLDGGMAAWQNAGYNVVDRKR